MKHKYKYIETDAEFSNYLEELRAEDIKVIALDVEAEYNLHSYGEKLCLIQIYDGKIPVIIDALQVSANLMKELFETRTIMKIMFDSSSDQRLLFKQYQIRINAIIDLKPAVDILDYERKNLGALFTDKLNLEPIDKKAFQMYNWQTRPIDAEAINYSIMDVLYLFQLKEIMFSDLENVKKMEEFRDKNFALQSKPPNISDKPAIFRKLLFTSLTKEQQKRFTKIYWIRDKYAQLLDFPPFHLFSNGKIRKMTIKPNKIETLKTRENVDIEIMNKLREELLDVSKI
ncbi:MAG: hypothetical protein KAS49_07785 [Candidatus Cloacimonetes bacterium]|nr:hypothetical protein [Candidatus Cloacimonadota bacterium]